MFIHLSIHYPHPHTVDQLIESMQRFGTAMSGQPGLQRAFTLRDETTGRLIGLALWDSKEEWEAARPAMSAAVEGDPFEEWEVHPPEVYHLEPVWDSQHAQE